MSYTLPNKFADFSAVIGMVGNDTLIGSLVLLFYSCDYQLALYNLKTTSSFKNQMVGQTTINTCKNQRSEC